MKPLFRRISSAHVIAVIALFVALGGTVYAAGRINGKTIKPGSIPGNRLTKNGVTGTQVNEGTLETVPHASLADRANQAGQANTANQATTATRANEAIKAREATKADEAKKAGEADTAKLALEANNSKALGGQPASAYQRSCASGTVKGVVLINSLLTTTSEFATFAGYNCAGGSIEAIHAGGPGEYYVVFNNLPGGVSNPVPVTVGVETGSATYGANARSVNVTQGGGQAPGFFVRVYNAASGAAVDGTTFTLTTY